MWNQGKEVDTRYTIIFHLIAILTVMIFRFIGIIVCYVPFVMTNVKEDRHRCAVWLSFVCSLLQPILFLQRT